MLPFAVEEYQTRLRHVKDRMDQQGLAVLVVSDPANMNYLTGYDGWSFYVPQAIIVALHQDEPLWIGRAQDANGARLTCWMRDEAIRPYADTYVQSPTQHPMDYVAQVLAEEHLLEGVIGLEMDAYYFTARSYQRLQEQLPHATLKDATLLVNWVRLIKSDQEIHYIQQAAAIVTQAMDTALHVIKPGVRECDAAAEIFRSQIRGTHTISGDYPAIVPLIPSGPRTSAAHLTWTDRRYEMGDAVNIEIAGCVRRYHCPLSRSVVIGPASHHLKSLAAVVVDGVNAALNTVRPGITCGEVEESWQHHLKRHGYFKESRLGYPFGLNYPPDWGEHTASLRSGDLTVLQPNMVFHLIAGMWLDGYGLEISEPFRVTPRGVETLTDVERQLLVIND